MRVLAIGDKFIPAAVMESGFVALRDLGHEVVVREWFHPDIKSLQADNLVVEQQGANAIDMPADLASDIADFDMLVVQFAPVGKSLVTKAKKLKYIGVLRAGTENIDHDATKAAGIEVIATPGRNARAVAEFTVGMILSEIRNIARANVAMKQGSFRKDFPNSACIPEMLGKKVGLIGLGNIGSLVAKFLLPFDCRILVFDPYLDKAPMGVLKVDSLDTLLADSDIVSMHMRLTEKTKHMIGAREISLMKSTAYLINTARSGLIDEDAMVKALQEKRIMGAAIDVFENEPLPAGSPVPALDNMTITPHIAGSTHDAFANTPILFCQRFIASHLS